MHNNIPQGKACLHGRHQLATSSLTVPKLLCKYGLERKGKLYSSFMACHQSALHGRLSRLPSSVLDQASALILGSSVGYFWELAEKSVSVCVQA